MKEDNAKQLRLGATVVDCVRKVAELKPDNVAATWQRGSITFGELMERAQALSFVLADLGVTNRSLVGVHLTRSVDMLISILAVLASGACYVPLDPEVPEGRLRHAIADSGTRFVLSEQSDAPFSSGLAAVHIHPHAGAAGGALQVPNGEDTAYLIYTSGSTGRPKGVQISHSALSNYVAWCLETLPFTGGGVPLFGSIAYDHVMTSLLPPLCAGEHLQLLSSIKGGDSLAEALLGSRGDLPKYSYLKITPSHMLMLTPDERAALARNSNMVLFGGERLQAELVRQLRGDNPGLRVMNHYGPTEATVGCCAYDIPAETADGTLPIGFPMPGVLLSIRDADFVELVEEEEGELFISGPGIAVGYWRQPEATKSAFVVLPDGSGTLRRWYRSGDLVRRRANGALEFIGRRDDQIKILGHRIEPVEVEAQIRTYDGVVDVCAFGVHHGWRAELVAAVVSARYIAEDDLRNHLRSRLTAAMIPSRFLVLGSLPTTPNGKADRAEIIRLLDARSCNNATGVEGPLLGKWREVMNNDNLSIEDDFFETGGDSMAAVEICFWAIARFSVALEPTVVFEYPTVRALAAHIETAWRENDTTFRERKVTTGLPS